MELIEINDFININNNNFVNFLCISFAILYTIIFVFAKYLVNYYKINVSNDIKIDFISRIVSSIQATLAFIFALCVLFCDKDLYLNDIFYKSYGITITLSMLVGYYIYDLVVVLFLCIKDGFDFGIITHHLTAMSAFYFCCIRGGFAYLAVLRLLSDISTIFLNNIKILMALKMKETKMFVYNAYTLTLTFFMFRIVPIIPWWLKLYSTTKTPSWSQVEPFYKSVCVFTNLPLDLLNIYWFTKLIKGALKVYRNKTKQN